MTGSQPGPGHDSVSSGSTLSLMRFIIQMPEHDEA